MHHPPSPGHTLPELCALLAALGIALLIVAPAVARTLDGLAVRSARDAVVVEATRARMLARARGGAILHLDAQLGAVWVSGVAGDTLSDPIPLTARFRARIELGTVSAATVAYDHLGLGRLANRTVRFVRNDADARLTVSAYGRVRAW